MMVELYRWKLLHHHLEKNVINTLPHPQLKVEKEGVAFLWSTPTVHALVNMHQSSKRNSSYVIQDEVLHVSVIEKDIYVGTN